MHIRSIYYGAFFLVIAALASSAIAQVPALADTDLALLGKGVITPLATSQPLTGVSNVFTAREGAWHYTITSGSGMSSTTNEQLIKIADANKEIWR